MCGVRASGCRSMVESQVHAKPMLSSQAVGLLAILADSGSKQELFRHVSFSQNHPPHVCLPSLRPESSAQPDTKTVESPQTSARPFAEKKSRQGVLKKVRFAPDVVEPTGDSREYRGRKSVDKAAFTKACGERQGHHEMGQSVKNADTSGASTLESIHGKVTKSRMPPNRMLLYKGMQCYRSKVMPCL